MSWSFSGAASPDGGPWTGRTKTLLGLSRSAQERLERASVDNGLTKQDVVDLVLRYVTDEELRRFLARAKILDGDLYARWPGV